MARTFVLAALALALSIGTASAATLTVEEARGIGLAPGSTVDAGKALVLKPGQHVTLISDAGATRTQASRYQVTLTERIRYVKVGQDEPIWANESFSFRDEYDVGSDPTAFFDQSGQAIERLSTSFARSLVAAMLEAF